jgi:hypothetical protein
MRPLMAEHLDGLRLAHLVVEEDHEPLIASKALPEDHVGEPCRPDHHRHGGRALVPEATQHRAELGPRRALEETGASVRAPYGGRDRAGGAERCPVTGEDGEVVAGGVRDPRIRAANVARMTSATAPEPRETRTNVRAP